MSVTNSRGVIPEEPDSLWGWRVRKQGDRGWRELGWAMTEEQALAWGDRDGYVIEKLANASAVPKTQQ